MTRKARVRRRHQEAVRGTRHPAGTAPGVLRPRPNAVATRCQLMAYEGQRMVEVDIHSAKQLDSVLDGDIPGICWLNVSGLADTAFIEHVGKRFGLHPLALEDVVNVHQRPKLEDYGDHVYIVLRMPSLEEELVLEQVSFFVGPHWVLTFQETEGDCLGGVRDRIRKPGTRMRQSGADYMAYALIDATVDANFPILEHYLDTLESIERNLANGGEAEFVSSVHAIRSDLHAMRRFLWPTRDLAASLARGEQAWVTSGTLVFLRDCHDHTVQLLDLTEACRDLSVSLMDLHMATTSNRMNEIMKMLTLIATIFIPLSFIAGVYGMNFDTRASPWNMPELQWYFGYPLALLLMLLTAVGFLFYFRRRGWL